MGTGFEETGIGPAFLASYGILGLVAVAVAGGGGEDGHFLQRFAADAVQGLTDPLRFQPGLLSIVHMVEIAAAAAGGDGASPFHPVGRFLQNLHDLACRPGFAYLFNADTAFFSGDGIGDEHGAALHMGNTLTFGSIIRNNGFINLVFCQHSFSSKRVSI